MIQINPSETFPIVRILADHTDSTTYYVRAVIKNAIDETVLATVDLSEISTRYFRYNWKVVWDNTMARGRYITITTSVYTDSGYANKSENYGDELETYLIQERWDAAKMQSMGGGGPGIGKESIKEALKELLDEWEFPEQKELDKEALIEDLTKSVIKNLPAIVFPIEEITNSVIEHLPEYPKTKDVDLSGIDQGIDKVFEEIKSRPKFEKTDFSALTEAIKEFKEAVKISIMSTFKEFMLEVNKSIEKVIQENRVKLNIDTNITNEATKQLKTERIKKLRTKHKL